MDTSIDIKYGYAIITIKSPVGIDTDVSMLKDMVEQQLQNGQTRIALHFPHGSFLRSRILSVLVQCVEIVRDHKGVLAIISPSEQILNVLTMFGLHTVVKLVENEDRLAECG